MLISNLVDIGCTIWGLPCYTGLNKEEIIELEGKGIKALNEKHRAALEKYKREMTKLARFEGSFQGNLKRARKCGMDVSYYEALYDRFLDRLEEKTIPYKELYTIPIRKRKPALEESCNIKIIKTPNNQKNHFRGDGIPY